MSARILFLDIETAPTVGYFYNRYDVNISPDQVLDNGFILCYQAAWDDGKVFVDSLRKKKFPLKPRDDKDIVRGLCKLLDQADIVVGHNIIKFDMGVINARCAVHGIKPYKKPKPVDTLRAARHFFKFEANSLASVCQQLGIGKKGHSGGFENTIACMGGDQKAWDKLLEYGKQDVVLVRKLYYRLLPWVNNHPNMNLYNDDLKPVCPNCESDKIQWRGRSINATTIYKNFQCQKCGRWGRSRVNSVDKEKSKVLVRGA